MFDGVVRKEPTDEEDEVVLAAFTGTKHFTGGLQWNHDGVWFPHADLVEHVEAHEPDLLFFSGDQIYEGDITGVERRPVERAILDYHDKWRRFCCTVRDLARDRPTICIPDDHDVFHGNLWGAGGRAAKRQDDGGYLMPPRFVNMVQRTQTAHLPRPVRSRRPSSRASASTSRDLVYGGVSFAILEDRKFKSSPTVAVPAGDFRNGWPQAEASTRRRRPTCRARCCSASGSSRSSRHWAADWSHGTWMKAVLSQTIFADVATIPREAKSGAVLAGLQPEDPGSYPRATSSPPTPTRTAGRRPAATARSARSARRSRSTSRATSTSAASCTTASTTGRTPASASACPRSRTPGRGAGIRPSPGENRGRRARRPTRVASATASATA